MIEFPLYGHHITLIFLPYVVPMIFDIMERLQRRRR